jgi:hypothetical protein
MYLGAYPLLPFFNLPSCGTESQSVEGHKTSSDEYYEEVGEGQIIPFKEADLSPACAHGCWTGAMRTSENSYKAKFAEFLFHALG